ncbi:MAG: hypothetical protein M3O20_15525 [Acidobacteriota bacterium]|nr:hypothetical protein [Acidobacteriota bacterium]
MESTEMLKCEDLLPGSMIDVETRSRHYRIKCLGGTSIRVSGHPDYCPEPVSANLHGSVDQEGVLEAGFIGRGLRMIFLLDDSHPITTSRVLHVRVEQSIH